MSDRARPHLVLVAGSGGRLAALACDRCGAAEDVSARVPLDALLVRVVAFCGAHHDCAQCPRPPYADAASGAAPSPPPTPAPAPRRSPIAEKTSALFETREDD